MPANKKIKLPTIVQTLLLGCLTGVAVGAAVALFLVCAKIVISFVFGLYAVGGALFCVCAIILALLTCFLIALIQTVLPATRGSGVPLIEGAARGMLRVRPLATAAGLIGGSLLSFLSGMPLGSEGPSVAMGGLIGDGIGRIAKRPMGLRRCLMSGGASAGLAVAFNAPLTGLCFAFEETHRRFSPQIIASALSSVITAVVTAQAIFYGLGHVGFFAGLGIKAGASLFPYLTQTAVTGIDLLKLSGIAIVCGIACTILGVLFCRAIEALSKLFSKIHTPFLRLAPAFLLAAALGLAVPVSVGAGEGTIEALYNDGALWLVLAVLAIRFATTTAASGSGATGGLFIPMLAIGGIAGIAAARLAELAGLDPALTPNIVMLCVCAFFAAAVRAPITAVLLSVELTASFANLLPCVIAMAVATVFTNLTKTEPLYERMLEGLTRSAPLASGARSLVVTGTIGQSSPVVGERVRDIMWPYNSLLTELDREGVSLVPDGETVLMPGDRLTVRAENVDADDCLRQLNEYMELQDVPPPSDPLFAAAAQNIYDTKNTRA